ncbi:MAG: agmatinase [Planctomycetes bacterium]|nr:agmatinase [Planctomycetota bacterium]
MPERARFFGGLVPEPPYPEARVVILPAPLERTVCYGKGAGRGPEAILAASAQIEDFDEASWRKISDAGIHTLPIPDLPEDPALAVERIAELALPVFLDGKFLVTLGGEHTVAAGAVRAAWSVWPDLGVLSLDAHADMRDSYQGTPWSHACTMRRIVEKGIPVEWCGLRSLSAEEAAWFDERGVRPRLDRERDREGRWIEELVAALPARVYLSIDIDGLDPACAPGTGTPEPGGLSFRAAERQLSAVASARHLVGADVCEVAPIAGQTVTESTAARLVGRIVASATC